MVTFILVVAVVPPPWPVMITVRVPSGAFLPTVTVMVEVVLPAGIGLGLKLVFATEDNVMLASKPPANVAVILVVPELPLAIVNCRGAALKVKLPPLLVPARALIRPLPLGLPQPVARS